jgi:hypothetical protein
LLGGGAVEYITSQLPAWSALAAGAGVGFRRSSAEMARSAAARRASSHRKPRDVPSTASSTARLAAASSALEAVSETAGDEQDSRDRVRAAKEARDANEGAPRARGDANDEDASLVAGAVTVADISLPAERGVSTKLDVACRKTF